MDVVIYCAKCGAGLDGNFNESTFNTINIEVQPCQECINRLFNKPKFSGLDRMIANLERAKEVKP